MSIVAWGGAGKTSLVAKWAGELATRGYDGASYFDGSFTSQGTREQAGASSQASWDSFIAAALQFFGAAELAGSPDAKKGSGDLAEARRLIETHGYHRRDEELAEYFPIKSGDPGHAAE